MQKKLWRDVREYVVKSLIIYKKKEKKNNTDWRRIAFLQESQIKKNSYGNFVNL